MKKVKQYLYYLLAVLAIFLNLNFVVSAEEVSYEITKEDLTMEVSADGSVTFDRQLYYDADYMNGVLYSVDLTDSSMMLSYDVYLYDENDKEYKKLKEEASQQANTYMVTNTDSSTEFKVFNPVRNKAFKIRFVYTLKGAVTNYLDTALFNYKLLVNYPSSLDVSAKLILPGVVKDSSDLRAWGFGAPQGTVSLKEEDSRSVVELAVEDNPRGQDVELLALFPTSLTINNENVINENKKEEIIAREEERAAEDRRLYEKYQKIENAVCIGLVIFVILAFFLYISYYNKKRSELNPNPVKLPRHYYELPADVTPAVASAAFFTDTLAKDQISATILDIARKGYIELEEVDRKKVRRKTGDKTVLITKKPDSQTKYQLKRHERAVLEYILPKEYEEDGITLEELENKTKKSKQFKKKQHGLLEDYYRSVDTQAEVIVERADTQRKIANFLALMPFIIVIIVHFIAVFAGLRFSGKGKYLAIPYVLSFIIMIVAAILHKKKPIETAEENLMKQEWQGFRNMLSDIGQMNMREIASLSLWQEYLAYATAFGLADKVMDAMRHQYSMEELAGDGFVVYGNRPYAMYRMINDSVDNTIDTVSRGGFGNNYTGQYSGTNVSGGGGGFSSGSSGGGGGGTAGGF